MKEIVQIQVGRCGNRIGSKFFEAIYKEHGLNAYGKYTGKDDTYMLDGIDVHFSERSSGVYTPRAILADLTTSPRDIVQSSPLANMYEPNQVITSTYSADYNFAKGYAMNGPEIGYGILRKIRGQIEKCDSPQGFQITQSLGGGTGSGLGALILQKLRDSYPHLIKLTYSVFPSAKAATLTEPYNATLAMHHLIENADATVIFDNEALRNVCQNTLKIGKPGHGDLNNLIAQGMSGFTAPMRFPSDGLKLHSNLSKVVANMIPNKRLHFLGLGVAPLTAHPVRKRVSAADIGTITTDLFSPRNQLIAFNPMSGESLGAAAIYRGYVTRSDVEKALKKTSNIPRNLIYDTLRVPSKFTKAHATLVSNNTKMADIMKRLAKQFGALWRRKSFSHYYTSNGVTEKDLGKAFKNLQNLIKDYQYASPTSKL